MASPNSNQIISLKITKFPQHLLVPGIDNTVSIQVMNYSNKEETFQLEFNGEGLEVREERGEPLNEVKFGPGETKNYNLKLSPTADGNGKLILNVYWLKFTQYSVKVQKIRSAIPKSKIDKILRKEFLPVFKAPEPFDTEGFISSGNKGDIKKLEKQIKIVKNGSNNADSNNMGIEGKDYDTLLKDLARAYLANNEFYKALETALQITNRTDQLALYYGLIRAQATVDLEKSWEVIKNLDEGQNKYELLKNIAIDQISINPAQIPGIISLVMSPSSKENILVEVISIASKKNIELASNLVSQIDNNMLQAKILFHLLKILHENKNTSQIIPLINRIIEILLNYASINLSENNYKNPSYDFLKSAITLLAELNGPGSIDSLLKGFSNQKIAEKLKQDLFDDLYEMVNEVRTKIEPTVVFSQYYLLNSYISNVGPEFEKFSLTGGNVSSNLLTKEYDIKTILISLFGFEFSIFPMIDRVYSDLRVGSNKKLAYYLYPSKNSHNKEEVGAIQKTLTQFFPLTRLQGTQTILNLDFIPYLGKPTVIISSDADSVTNLKSKIESKFSDKIKVMIDDGLFKGGKSLDMLKKVFYSGNFKILNLVLSYEFINDYESFKSIIELMA